MGKEKLGDILETVNNEELNALLDFILNSREYEKLFRCTQMRDEVLRDDKDKTTNRGLHTIQVATNARKLATYLLERKNSRELSEKNVKLLNKEEQKEILIAEIVGISHDLGHLPMAHASEMVCGEKIGKGYKFGHDKYGGVVFAELFEKFCDSKALRKRPEVKEKLKKSGIKDYIIEGIQNHGKYMSYWAEGNSKTDLPLICGRLADTLSFMPADLQGLSQVDRADEIDGKIISKDIMMSLVKDGVTTVIGVENTTGIETSKDLPTEKIISDNQTLASYYQKNNPTFNYEKVIDDLISGNPDKLSRIQAQVLKEVAVNNVNEKGEINSPLVSISDNLKLLREAECNFRGHKDKKIENIDNIPWALKEYEKKNFELTYNGEKDNFDNAFTEYLQSNVCTKSFSDYQSKLNKETNDLRKNCPTLALLYEIQDELIYNQLLYKSTRVLGNDEMENKKVLSAIFDKFKAEYMSLDPKSKQEFENTYKSFEQYMPLKSDTEENLKAKAYAAYKLQQLTNDDVDRERETRDFIEAIKHRDFSKIMKVRAESKEVGNYQEEAIAHSEGFKVLEDASVFEEIFRNLEESEQEQQKEQLIDENDKIESRTVIKSIPDYINTDTQKLTETTRVSIFGIDSWKKIIGDRTVANLQDMAIKIKNTRDKDKVQINGIDTIEGR